MIHRTYPIESSESWRELFGEEYAAHVRTVAQEAIAHTTGPAVEIGGPTSNGFVALDDLEFPHGLIVTNRYTSLLAEGEQVDAMADVRHLPFSDGSLGCIITNALTRVPEEIAQSRDVDFSRFGKTHWQDMNNFDLLLTPDHNERTSEAIERVGLWANQDVTDFSLRIALAKEARRTLEPGGVLITGEISEAERRLFNELGFELATDSIDRPDRNREKDTFHGGEHVFILKDLSTAAGLFIEMMSQQTSDEDPSHALIRDIAAQAIHSSPNEKERQERREALDLEVETLGRAIYEAEKSESHTNVSFDDISEAEQEDHRESATVIILNFQYYDGSPDTTTDWIREDFVRRLHQDWLGGHPEGRDPSLENWWDSEPTQAQEERYINQVELAKTLGVGQAEVLNK